MKIDYSHILIQTLRTIFLSTIFSLIGLGICYLCLPEDVFIVKDIMCSSDQFARKWDGTCPGWGKDLSIDWMIGHLKHWWSYTLIAFAVWVNHPRVKNDFQSIATVILTGSFVQGCGLTHLI